MSIRRGTYWQDDEVEVLLGLVLRSRDLSLLMRSTHLHTTRAYERLSRRMAAKGFPWTCQQIRSKFKNVKNAFYSSLELLGGGTETAWIVPLPLLYAAFMGSCWQAALAGKTSFR